MLASSHEWNVALQLTLDVSPPTPRSRKRRLTSRNPSPGSVPSSSIPARKNSLMFHEDGSSIASDRFALKFLFGDRSYLLQGAYRIHEGKSRYDGEEYTTVESVRIDRIYAYKNGAYVFIPVTKSERERFERAAFEVLVNPRYNESFAAE